MGDDDKRRAERVVINREFSNFEAFVEEYVTNISRTGVFIRTKTPLAIGTRVRLRFSVIMTEIETVEGEGEVVRVQDDPPGMGVVFTSLTSYSAGLLEKLLTRRPH
ncbi:MAG: hypothetical protein A2516_02375 [Alphaproteobacteria bacterium RIFOXYD12_FULL_60_8]|nr:MAG: hypothetical protein A2516_02375 [Alphaproteobacteria bacterium RIFOXYD12_FULL_60_8]